MSLIMSKICSKCGVDRPISEFYSTSDGRVQNPCKECRKKYRKEYYRNNRGHILAQQKEQYDNPRTGVRKRHLSSATKHRYGFCHDTYLYHIGRLTAIQDGKCAICGESGDLHLDHNHDTGEIRGLLCPYCNGGIGMLRENIDIMKAAIRYIENIIGIKNRNIKGEL